MAGVARDSEADTGGGAVQPDVDPWCALPAASVSYADRAAAWGLVDTADGEPRRKEAGAVAALDLDGDGLDELIVAHRSRGLVLHHNRDGAFVLQDLLPARELSGIALGDIDGDGDLDTGPQKMDASFGDFDQDGHLDLYITHAGPPDRDDERFLDKLLRGRGDGTFDDVSGWLTAPQRQGTGWAPAWTDLDRDGDLDLFVANADQGTAGPSLMLETVDPRAGDASTFADRTDTCGCTTNFNPMGVSPGDFDNDGDIDLFLTNTASDQLLANQGDATFIDVSRAAGAMDLPGDRHMTFGSVWVDHDNDGWQDLFVSAGPLSDVPEPDLDAQPDRLLVNAGGVAFTNEAPALGLDSTGIGRGVTRAMLDDDGFAELVVVNLDGPSHLWQPACTAARALVVQLSDAGPNTRGLGAWVTVELADGRQQVQEISTKPGWGGAMEPRAWFGLGDAAVASLTVRWPDGVVEAVSVPARVDGRLTVTRGDR